LGEKGTGDFYTQHDKENEWGTVLLFETLRNVEEQLVILSRSYLAVGSKSIDEYGYWADS
jgi:hypothetical protein